MHAHASELLIPKQISYNGKLLNTSLIMHCITQYSYYQLVLYNENTSFTSVIMVLQTNTMVFKNIVIKSPANRGMFVKVPRDAFGLRPQAFPRDFHKHSSVCGRFNHYILKNHCITYKCIPLTNIVKLSPC